MHITLAGLVPEAWKPLTDEERTQLFQAVGRETSQGEAQSG
jgi:hypothetical protein